MALREYVIIDTETSGLSPENDRITEIAAIRIKDGGISDEFCTLIKQDIVLSPEITDMTGITAEMLSFEGIPIKEALEKLTAFVGSSPTVMHNAGFDSRFLILEARRCGVEPFPEQVHRYPSDCQKACVRCESVHADRALRIFRDRYPRRTQSLNRLPADI